jgi:hypothetical protein
MQLKKSKNYPKMISFLLSAENPEHALSPQSVQQVGDFFIGLQKGDKNAYSRAVMAAAVV